MLEYSYIPEYTASYALLIQAMLNHSAQDQSRKGVKVLYSFHIMY